MITPWFRLLILTFFGEFVLHVNLNDHLHELLRMKHPPKLWITCKFFKRKCSIITLKIQPPNIVTCIPNLLPQCRLIWTTHSNFRCNLLPSTQPDLSAPRSKENMIYRPDFHNNFLRY